MKVGLKLVDPKNIHYGLDKVFGIVDTDWFWQEVALRSENNYGEWETYAQAMNRVTTAIFDIAKDAGLTSDRRVQQIIDCNHYRIGKQIKRMLQD